MSRTLLEALQSMVSWHGRRGDSDELLPIAAQPREVQAAMTAIAKANADMTEPTPSPTPPALSLLTAARLVAIHRNSVDIAPSRRTPHRKPRWVLTGFLLALAVLSIAYVARALV